MFQWSEAAGLLRLATGLRRFLREPISTEEARRLVRERVARRGERLLRKLDCAVFGNPKSPYRKLMKAAGCEPGDVRKWVEADGVEATLARLAQAGIYVTWEEFKGRMPVRRGAECWQFNERDFDNPAARAHFLSSSGGSSGTPVRTRMDLEELGEAASDWAVWFDAWGWVGRPLIFWAPGHTGLASRYLRCAKFGARYRRYFLTTAMTDPADRFRSWAVHGLARLAGGFPKPEPGPVNEPDRVAACLAELLERGEKPLVNTSPSAAAGLSLAMARRGKRLDGVTFLLGAEPVTAERRRTIEACGAAAAPTYGTSEGGWIGAQFPGARAPDEVHLFTDAYAIIQRDRFADGDGAGPIAFTNLRNASPKVLLNAELGDAAIVEYGSTGEARELGFDVRLHTIRSFRKITAWGVTLAVSDLYPLLEETLPRRFGGGASDYQLVEEQDDRGMPALRLLVSPDVGPIAESQVREAFFRELSRRRSYYGFMTALLHQADALRVERRRPVATGREKILPVAPQRSGGAKLRG